MRIIFLKKCDHEWHYVQNCGMYIYGKNKIQEGCYIFCPKCKKEKIVLKKEWERMKRKQEILEDYNNNYKNKL